MSLLNRFLQITWYTKGTSILSFVDHLVICSKLAECLNQLYPKTFGKSQKKLTMPLVFLRFHSWHSVWQSQLQWYWLLLLIVKSGCELSQMSTIQLTWNHLHTDQAIRRWFRNPKRGTVSLVQDPELGC